MTVEMTLIWPRESADINKEMGGENVDRRLLERFEASVQHERARRELLPPMWINAEPEPSPDDQLGTVYEDTLRRARERVHEQRQAMDAHVRKSGLDPAV
ncbi:MAG TPA: hypothetical protein VJM07_08365 [Gaiella sp.]|nr:hypothetical protein [Gaiella sp.]